MDRIFYIIPYTSIIDQNADEVRKILEDRDDYGQFLDRVVLEHHSNLTPEEETRRQSLLAENWDSPIVFTTQVQFLETLFGSGTRSARRMHQLANSVIIFDEVQTIPIRCVHMFNLALRFLVHDCGSTVVLCTATQPLLDEIIPENRTLTIQPEQQIISNEKGTNDTTLVVIPMRYTGYTARFPAYGVPKPKLFVVAASESNAIRTGNFLP